MVTHFPCLWQVGFELPAAVVGRANGRSKERPSVARSVQFSVAIDTWATTVSEAHEKPVRGAGGRRFGPERPLRGPQRPRNSRNGEKGPCPPGNRERPTAPPGNRPGSGPPAPRGRHRSLTSDAMSAQRILASEVCGFQLPLTPAGPVRPEMDSKRPPSGTHQAGVVFSCVRRTLGPYQDPLQY